MAERVSAGASVKNVFGEPVAAGHRTVIPAARVRYAFGAGGGSKDDAVGWTRVRRSPAARLEITPEGTRFLAFEDNGPSARRSRSDSSWSRYRSAERPAVGILTASPQLFGFS